MKDLYGRKITYLRLSVTDLCNLRCRYCMPGKGVCKKAHSEMLTEDEMICAVKAAASMGICKLRITGGEPLIKPNILSICSRVSEIVGIDQICLTTNGTLLNSMAQELHNAGISRINISLDTLDEQKYAWITRGGDLRVVLKGIEAALNTGFEKVKLNVVLTGGFNEDETPSLIDLTRRWPVDVRFIELMPMAGNLGMGEEFYVPYTHILEKHPELIPVLNTEGEGVAKLYRLPEALGRVGIISAVNRHFCRTCNRIRLTADGKIKPCLHSNGMKLAKNL